jgi:hypothetical protein
MEVFGGMFVRRRVATAHVAAGHAEAQVHPLGADAQAIFTTVRAGCDFFNLIEMSAFHFEVFSLTSGFTGLLVESGCSQLVSDTLLTASDTLLTASDSLLTASVTLLTEPDTLLAESVVLLMESVVFLTPSVTLLGTSGAVLSASVTLLMRLALFLAGSVTLLVRSAVLLETSVNRLVECRESCTPSNTPRTYQF